MQILAIAATALVLATSVVEAAKATVNNQCTFPVYLWSVTNEGQGAMWTIPAGKSYSEDYRVPKSGGVSIKIAKDPSVTGPITQFEYTLAGKIWYDLSNINCKGKDCPFQPYGMYLRSGTGCPTVSCPGGEEQCSGAYNNPDDNWASLACAGSEDSSVNLCSAGPYGGSSPAAPAQGPASTMVTSITTAPTANAPAAAPQPTATAATRGRGSGHPRQRPKMQK